MSGFSEYADFDATGLAELVDKGEGSSRELVEQAIRQIEETNPTINAVIHEMFDDTLERADRPPPEGTAFPGVPFLLKDDAAAYAGVPLRSGSRSLSDHIPDEDSEIAKRHKAARLITVGKTNLPEFTLAPVTEPELFGPTRNPMPPLFHTPQ